MFVRVEKSGGYEYLYLVENVRKGGRHVQRVIKALGRRDEVENSKMLDGLIASAARHEGREVDYGFRELDELVLAYATTIHKAQGSEYPAVVIPLMTQHYVMLARNLLYTGVTRGKRLVVLVGQRKALAMAIRNVGSRRRWSRLRAWLEQAQSNP